MPLVMPLAGMISALLVHMMISQPSRVLQHGRRRRERDLEASTRRCGCCRRQGLRGLARMQKEQAKHEQLLKQRSMADAEDREAVMLEVAFLSGSTLRISTTKRTTGRELRRRISELAE